MRTEVPTSRSRRIWWALTGGAIGFMAIAVAVPVPAQAQTATPLDVRIERDLSPRVGATELSVNLIVTITDATSGAPPTDDFDVFALAQNPQEKTTAFNCVEIRNDDPTAPEGVYACTVIVDYGGKWDFAAVVNQERLDEDEPPVTLAQASLPLELGGPTARTTPADDGVESSVSDVAILWGHSLVAVSWLAAAGLLLALSLPGTRRMLSHSGLYRIEERLDLLVRITWTTTAVTVGSGVYLLVNQTAYDTPFSASGLDRVFELPYAKPYFLSLGVKLAAYALMIGAVVPLVGEARRQRRLSGAPAAPTARARRTSAIWSSPASGSGGSTLLAAPPESPPATEVTVPVVESHASGRLRLSAIAISAGGAVIWMCVILLKYFHQLVEASP